VIIHALLPVAFAFLFVGCSSGSDSNPASSGPCDAFSTASCKHFAACDAYSFRAVYVDDGQCRAAAKSVCLDEIGAPDTGLTTDALNACASDLSAANCESHLPATCGPTTGKRNLGQACVYGSQCVSAYCTIPVGKTCGTCAPSARMGQTCGGGTTCIEGVCSGAGGTCVAFAAKGESCKSIPCDVNLQCTVGTLTCDDPPAPGSTCDPSKAGDCDLGAGLFCSTSTKQCTAVPFAAAGESCAATDKGGPACAASGVCGTAGTCVAPAQEGQTCDPSAGPRCIPPASCIASTCQTRRAGSCG
jgi:hypothetical protein